MNRPIPPTVKHDVRCENILRSPHNFLPIWGDFGPETCHSPPTSEDLNAAFWVVAKQNAIQQIWAPRWTMFSRGNISEKVRLLNLASVRSAVAQGTADGRGCAAVDLYAGIGYFAFSYLKAGFDHVLCWDINPWSIEGLRRGAAANKWSVAMCNNEGSFGSPNPSHARLLIFSETNELAAERVRYLGDGLAPVRHVNCGLLPTSRRSWQTALAVLDSTLGGWIHIHENCGVDEVQQEAEAIRDAFQDMVDLSDSGKIVKVEGIHRVKSYAPRIVHCVIDIFIPALHPD